MTSENDRQAAIRQAYKGGWVDGDGFHPLTEAPLGEPIDVNSLYPAELRSAPHGRHAYTVHDIGRPIPKLMPPPPRHRADTTHRHVFVTVAEFTGRRSSIAQCLGRLEDGTICEQTKTVWA